MSIAGTSAGTSTARATLTAGFPRFPLKASDDGRHLVDQLGVPFFVNGDTAWSLISTCNPVEVGNYLDDRAARGVNAIIVELIEEPVATNYNGDAPFSTPNNFGTPNSAYFNWAKTVIDAAAARGIVVFLWSAYIGFQTTPIEGWLLAMEADTLAHLRSYGQYIATLLLNSPNIVWVGGGDWLISGADFTGHSQTTTEIMHGILDVDTSKLMTAHWKRTTISTDASDNEATVDWLDANGVYTGLNVTGRSKDAYDRSPHIPAWLAESYYVGRGSVSGHTVTEADVREFFYSSWLGGCIAGSFSGRENIWPFPDGFEANMGGTGDAMFLPASQLVAGRAWHKLVPDFTSALVTAGRGTFDALSYVTAAMTADGTLAVIYIPHAVAGSITVARGAFARTIWARWYDPTNGAVSNVSGSPFTNSGSSSISKPGNNAAGDNDWVLLLEATTPSLGNTAEANEMRLILNNATWPRIGDVTGIAGSSAAGSLYVSLHTASPTDTGGQTSSECAYTNYTRTGVARTTSGWIVSGTSPTIAVNASTVSFPKSGSGPETASHFGVGTDSAGASGHIVYWGALDASLIIGVGVVPTFQPYSLTITRD